MWFLFGAGRQGCARTCLRRAAITLPSCDSPRKTFCCDIFRAPATNCTVDPEPPCACAPAHDASAQSPPGDLPCPIICKPVFISPVITREIYRLFSELLETCVSHKVIPTGLARIVQLGPAFWLIPTIAAARTFYRRPSRYTINLSRRTRPSRPAEPPGHPDIPVHVL
jgi:hypothetical protein